MNINKVFFENLVFFSRLGFLSRTFTNHRTAAEKGEVTSSFPPLPLIPTTQKLRYEAGYYCRSSSLQISTGQTANHEPLVFELNLNFNCFFTFLFSKFLENFDRSLKSFR